MGRFATTVPLYEKFRPPYPPDFFRTVAARLGFGRKHRLIDLGTGPGLLALGFAPYVGRTVGVDPEPAMLTAARQAARRAGQNLTLIEAKAEVLTEDAGQFDVVTIGRALHWMEPKATVRLFDRLVAPDGVILICSSNSAADSRNAWHDDYRKARDDWSGVAEGVRYGRQVAAVLAGTRFVVSETIAVESTHEVQVDELAQRILTFSSSSPAVLGDRVQAMLWDVAQRLLPYSDAGRLSEVVVSTAQVVRET